VSSDCSTGEKKIFWLRFLIAFTILMLEKSSKNNIFAYKPGQKVVFL